MKKNLQWIIVVFCAISAGYSQSKTVWKPINESDLRSTEKVNRSTFPATYKIFNLDLQSFKSALSNSPLRGNRGKSSVIIELPDASGKIEHYRVHETPIMEPTLAEKFPMIKSYAAQGIEDPTAVARFSVTQFGLHSMTLSGEKSTAFIDPYTTDKNNYIVYDKASLGVVPNDFTCLTNNDVHLPSLEHDRKSDTDDKKLRTYRLAQSCTAEYGNIFAGTTGTDEEKKANIQAQMAITMTRVNGVYENDLSITMIFVANNDAVIYFGSTTTDPWSGEFNTQTGRTIDANIGFENYDIGHNFNTSGGGNAGCIGCVCSTDSNPASGNHKGTGMTGRSNPTGDPFDIDYVAHEMGHQFGGFHTQSSSGCRSGSGFTEVEPGSGSTIMGYAGICPANVQSNSDAYFAYVNVRDILDNVKSGVSSSCAQITEIDNNPPTVSLGSDFVIPKSTPFVLTAAGSDPDGDAITYNWEQNDPENPGTSAAPTPTRAVGPMFRSVNSSTSPTRYFPNLATILTGNTRNTWEVIPSIGRALNFSVTVRDNHAGGGQTDSALIKVTVNANAGPFLLNTPNTNVSWVAGTNETVTWDVAGTDANGVNAKYVDIYLSTNNGTDFPILLASKVPNDGSEVISVPNIAGSQNRIMVRGYNNVFFDVSNASFTITPAETTFAPAFTGVAEEQNKTTCTGSTVSYSINYNGFEGFAETTTFTVTGNPAGSTVTLTPATISASGTVVMNVATTGTTAPGFYTLAATATSGTQVKTVNYYLELFNSDFAQTVLATPMNMATAQGTTLNLTWEADSNATSYDVQVASDAAFNTIVASGTTSSTSFRVAGLEETANYFWRILPKNVSCSGSFSEPFQFRTGQVNCAENISTNVPLPISASGSPTVNSTLNVPNNGVLSDVNVTLNMTHTYVGDVTISLISPTGTTVQLINSACGSSDNVNATFDDAGVALLCSNNPAISGTVIPVQPLSAFNGENPNGNWTLRVKDNEGGDGGSLVSWSLDVCAVGPELGTKSNSISNFAVYPNPNSGSFNIRFDNDATSAVNVAVYDLRGRQIYANNFQQKAVFDENINLNVEAGIYMITVKNGDKQEVRKIVVE